MDNLTLKERINTIDKQISDASDVPAPLHAESVSASVRWPASGSDIFKSGYGNSEAG